MGDILTTKGVKWGGMGQLEKETCCATNLNTKMGIGLLIF